MYYYEVAILGKPLLLTYHSSKELENGQIVQVSIKNRLQKGVVLQKVAKPAFDTLEMMPTKEYLQPWQLELAQFIARYYVCFIGEALSLFVPFKKCEQKSLSYTPTPSILTPQQQKALEFIKRHDVSLLFGETGSGKTEVYIQYFKEIVAKRQEAIFLMPEISLTPQMEKRLREVFGDMVVMWHSKLTQKRRSEALEKIRSGQAKIVAGPRSALFLPLKRPGLIVVDEEHDESYKAQSRPRINAKDMAVYMGKLLKIPVVLGSATPSLTSYYRYESVRLSSFARAKKEFVYDSGRGLSPIILDSLDEVLQRGKQALFFLPTRAYFKYLVCQECGQAVQCPFCDVGMSVHFDKRALMCHYCNYTEPIVSTCPSCGSQELSAQRQGTSEIVQELRSLFPKAKVEKFDRDAITTQKKLEKCLASFAQGDIDILVGTQMLSKGHDYPDVALAVIMDIDYTLAMADFRARERAASLFLQIAGRTGRKEEGKVIVQTKNRDFFQRYQEYELFLREELEFRRDLYPPFRRLAQLLFAHKDQIKAKRAMEEMVECLKRFEDVQIVGFGPAAIEKIAGKYRYHILLRSASPKKLLQAIYGCKNDLCEVDMDPVSFV